MMMMIMMMMMIIIIIITKVIIIIMIITSKVIIIITKVIIIMIIIMMIRSNPINPIRLQKSRLKLIEIWRNQQKTGNSTEIRSVDNNPPQRQKFDPPTKFSAKIHRKVAWVTERQTNKHQCSSLKPLYKEYELPRYGSAAKLFKGI